ncbi:DUF1707 SHOCT-like domain-containing protein [Amycolatopsis granulosa]|uniref:DUF1707 SHOCT-like domain-containing protein n=1 Tax=Amycolatopsis granulosa TaxID=185684 RepID=UPI001422BE9B|nr:DUF1707 domain-containing protein [Amycolatopsis granulosa]NIH83313.1 hypothetical protein [Amycolatopsis granulosa]
MTTTRDFAARQTSGAVRCSDAERDRVGARLQEAVGEGRLSLSEVEDRMAKVYAARYRHELDDLVADLPPVAGAATGWSGVLAAARDQLAADWAAMRQGGLATRRTLAYAAVVLTLLVLAMIAFALVLHGISGGYEPHHHFGRR